jgi:hypothetical protein
MKPGKPEPSPQNKPGTPGAIPANLLAALNKMQATGAFPVMITRELEAFLTEQGVFRGDMTPEEAWVELYSIAIAAGKVKTTGG